MSDEKPLPAFGNEVLPLFVQVAVALGWWSLECRGQIMISLPDKTEQDWYGYAPSEPPVIGKKVPVPKYSTDWSGTGPLIEKYGLRFSDHRNVRPERWAARCAMDWDVWGYGDTHLIAACHLILALKEAGKL